jgi:AcrR family transcriptional regulator
MEAIARTAALDETAHDKLLAAATELFARRGYAAATVREIVAAAGVTKPVLYYYFGSKEGIFLEIMHEAFAHIEELTATARSGEGSAARRILDFCDRGFVLFLEHVPVVRVMYSIYYGPPQGAPHFDFEAFHESFQEEITQLVEEGVAAGEFRADCGEAAMWAVLGAFNIAMELELCHPEVSFGRSGLERTLKVVLAGLARGESSEKE